MKDEDIERQVEAWRKDIAEEEDLNKYIKELKKGLTWKMRVTMLLNVVATVVIFTVLFSIVGLFAWLLIKLLLAAIASVGS